MNHSMRNDILFEPNFIGAVQKAHSLLDEFSSFPVNLEALAFAKGLKIDYRPLDDTVSGMLLLDKKVIVINSLHHPNRQRFTLAHELGHYFLHDDKPIFLDDSRVFHRDGEASEGIYKREIEANAFAAELLMPKQEIIKMVRRLSMLNKAEIERLAKKFEVSVQAMTYRLVNLGLLSGLDSL